MKQLDDIPHEFNRIQSKKSIQVFYFMKKLNYLNDFLPNIYTKKKYNRLLIRMYYFIWFIFMFLSLVLLNSIIRNNKAILDDNRNLALTKNTALNVAVKADVSSHIVPGNPESLIEIKPISPLNKTTDLVKAGNRVTQTLLTISNHENLIYFDPGTIDKYEKKPEPIQIDSFLHISGEMIPTIHQVAKLSSSIVVKATNSNSATATPYYSKSTDIKPNSIIRENKTPIERKPKDPNTETNNIAIRNLEALYEREIKRLINENTHQVIINNIKIDTQKTPLTIEHF